MQIFGKEKPLKEYICGDKKFYFYGMTRKRKKKLDRNLHNQGACARNGDWVGLGRELAEMAALFLTPEGDHPDKKDVFTVREEFRNLPHRFVFEVIGDIHRMGEAVAEGKDLGE